MVGNGAVQAIVKKGGRFSRDEEAAGRPITRLFLGGTQVTDAELKELKTALPWVLHGLWSLVGAMCMLIGLRSQKEWVWRRCALWGSALLLVPPAAVVVFWIFAAIGLPLSI
jgi:hypothetical protein